MAEIQLVRPIRADDDAIVAALLREVLTEHGAVGPGFAFAGHEIDTMSAAYDAEGAL